MPVLGLIGLKRSAPILVLCINHFAFSTWAATRAVSLWFWARAFSRFPGNLVD